MKRIFDQKKIRSATEQIGLQECLERIDPGIMICEYAAGELVISPLQQSRNILFLLEGEASVYVLDEDGTMIAAAREMAGSMIGDPELFLEQYESVYVEAKNGLRVLALPYDLCLRELRDNEQFTHFLIRKILLRENQRRQIDNNNRSNKEKALFFIQNLCKDQCTTSVAKVADSIRCSYRQTQRILRELVEEGILTRTGKGQYCIKK